MLAVMQLAFVTTTSESFRQIKLWIDYHKSIGVNHFYLFVDGQVRCSSYLNCKGCPYGKYDLNSDLPGTGGHAGPM